MASVSKAPLGSPRCWREDELLAGLAGQISASVEYALTRKRFA